MQEPHGDAIKTLAIDLGTHTGWACRSEDHDLTSGLYTLASPKEKATHSQRCAKFRTWLIEKAPDEIVYERVTRYYRPGTKAAELRGALREVVEGYCHYRGIPCYYVTVEEVKEHAVGNPKASKQVMKAAANKKWDPVGNRIQDENQADALWVLDAHFEGKSHAVESPNEAA
jgi:Holliday junction resolvasome RuvABC endonuclease subunit